jgi:hypothetical protein
MRYEIQRYFPETYEWDTIRVLDMFESADARTIFNRERASAPEYVSLRLIQIIDTKPSK